MFDKHNCDIAFCYKSGFFRRFSAVAPLQLYQLNERETTSAQPLDSTMNPRSIRVVVCISGEGVLQSADNAISLRKNEVVFIGDLESEYTLCANENASIRYSFIELAFFETMETTVQSAVYTHFTECKATHHFSNGEMGHVVSQLIAELCLPSPMTTRIRSLLDQMLIYIYRGSVPKEESLLTGEPSVNAVGHTVYAIIRYIDDNLYAIHSLMEMAEKLGYSYNYLSHLFRRKTGMTIQNYFAQKKIEASCELLVDDRNSITEISTMLNYDCIQSFSKAFKKAMGISPTEFRAAHGKKP